jgi:hypothetical protein
MIYQQHLITKGDPMPSKRPEYELGLGARTSIHNETLRRSEDADLNNLAPAPNLPPQRRAERFLERLGGSQTTSSSQRSAESFAARLAGQPATTLAAAQREGEVAHEEYEKLVDGGYQKKRGR